MCYLHGVVHYNYTSCVEMFRIEYSDPTDICIWLHISVSFVLSVVVLIYEIRLGAEPEQCLWRTDSDTI
jgi:hypothetical protein